MIVISDILAVEARVSGFDAVLFDLDDTLYSEKEYVRSGYRQVAALFPEHPGAEDMLWGFFLKKKPAIDCFLEQIGAPSDLKAKCLEVYRTHDPDIHLYPGVRDMLIRLKRRHRLGLITDGRPEGQRAKIRALGIAPLFDAVVVTDELGGAAYRKPNPIAFQQMAERFGAACGRMCYIGDNINKDVEGPESLGMTAILFQNRDGLYTGGILENGRKS